MELEKYSNSKGLDFIVSCWDLKSLELIEKNCNVKYHKIASALLTDKTFLEYINATGKPVILSTGMSDSDQIRKAMAQLQNVRYILACTSTYPTKDEEVNLNYIRTLGLFYGLDRAGFSNHSNGVLACFGAVACGAKCIEFHITKDRTMYGSDQSASIEDVDVVIGGIRKMELLLGDGEKHIYESEVPIAKKLRKTNTI